MFAIIKDRGKQYRVNDGEALLVDLRGEPTGEEIVFDQVLVVGPEGEGDIQVGTPMLDGARVSARVLGEVKGKKIKIFRYKPRNKSTRRRGGHRQRYTRIRVESIQGSTGGS